MIGDLYRQQEVRTATRLMSLVIHEAATFPGLVLTCKIIGVLQVEQHSKGKKAKRNDRLFAKMKERGFVHVPIVNQESKPVGVINARDAFEVVLGDVENDVSFLRDYVTGIGYH